MSKKQSKRNPQETVKEASKPLENGGGEAIGTFQNTSWSTLKGLQEYNELLLEIAQTNVDSALRCLRQMVTVKSPSEFIIVATENARRQYELSIAHAKELSASAQSLALISPEPIRRQIGKMSDKAA